MELEKDEQREVGRKARVAAIDAVRSLGGAGLRADIIQRAVTSGAFSDRELATPAPQTSRDKHPSFVHYRLSWALTDLKRDGLLENPRWSLWQLAGAALQPSAPLVPERISDERLAELRAMPYHLYRRTTEWKRTRASALERAGHRCALDRAHTDRLEVHHNTYDRLGDELASDLVVLCRACHQLHHQAHGRPRRPKPHPETGARLKFGSVPPPARSGEGSAGPRLSHDRSSRRSLLRRLLPGV